MITRNRLEFGRRPYRFVTVLLAAAAVSLAGAAPAAAYAPVNIVHTEHVQVGPYPVTVGFSTWPLRAMQSLDFTFIPDGGIAGKSGTLTQTGPGIEPGDEHTPLVRHPRQLDAWGLDVVALNAAGTYAFEFIIDGPQGQGRATLPLTVLDQPGPPLLLSWTIGSLPFIALIVFLSLAWHRTRPGRQLLRL
jgi:hypothetical protein